MGRAAPVTRGVSLPSTWSRQSRPAGQKWSRQARLAEGANGVHVRWRSTHPQIRQQSPNSSWDVQVRPHTLMKLLPRGRGTRRRFPLARNRGELQICSSDKLLRTSVANVTFEFHVKNPSRERSSYD